MLGIDGPEFVVLLIILIVVVGPKDLPKMMRAFGKATARMRATANEFRQQFNDAMREAELDDVQKTLSDVKNLDPRKKLTSVFDPIRDVAKDVRSSLDMNETSEAVKAAPHATEIGEEVVSKSDNLVKIIPGVNPALDAMVAGAEQAAALDKAAKAQKAKPKPALKKAAAMGKDKPKASTKAKSAGKTSPSPKTSPLPKTRKTQS